MRWFQSTDDVTGSSPASATAAGIITLAVQTTDKLTSGDLMPVMQMAYAPPLAPNSVTECSVEEVNDKEPLESGKLLAPG